VYVLITYVTEGEREAVQELVSLLRLHPRLSDVLYSAQAREWFTM